MKLSPLQVARYQYSPKLPGMLRNGISDICVCSGGATESGEGLEELATRNCRLFQHVRLLTAKRTARRRADDNIRHYRKNLTGINQEWRSIPSKYANAGPKKRFSIHRESPPVLIGGDSFSPILRLLRTGCRGVRCQSPWRSCPRPSWRRAGSCDRPWRRGRSRRSSCRR